MTKLLFVVNVDWFFISHRLPIALSAMKKGYEVHLACADTGKCDALEGLGIRVHRIKMSRSGTHLLSEIKSLWSIFSVVRKVKPDILHGVTIKPVVYSSLVSRICGVKKRVFSISGLGYVFIDESPKAKVLRQIISRLYKFGLNNDNSTVIFQNSTDRQTFIDLKIVQPSSARLIRGSGVDLSEYRYSPVEADKPSVMFLARLLKDKGVIEFCEAVKSLKNAHPSVDFVLVGDLDPENPNSMSIEELTSYVSEGVVRHIGYRKDIPQVISSSTIMVLPSYREGLPKSLIEAAACGRAVVTTDVPGCRDAIEPDVTGVLVPARNISELASAIEYLLLNPEKTSEMGRQGRRLAETTFSIDDVITAHFKIYENN
ncbi:MULTISPECIES: glycosyltransferase family 4 protein [unclassified Alteromonas]|uniref:glycosyltransferase family 4 protein n=1 Tax=unclassified Alteromonas TaxID=2614992 RepID=UPI000509AB5D|nr:MULTISPECIES: glycosyltransferase family 4 protein [unclassified Alteromonas]